MYLLQDTFKYLGGKTTSTAIHLATERHLLLFDELLLLTKKKEDHFVYHHHINVRMYVCTYACVCVCTRARVCVCRYVCVCSVCAYVRVYMYVCVFN